MALRVLVVAPDRRRRAPLTRGITSHGYEVLDMANADVEAAVRFGPHVAVVDLVGEPAAGFAAAKALRFVPGGRHGVRPLAGLPIVALTADETWKDRLHSQVPAVIVATESTMPGELWELRHRAQ